MNQILKKKKINHPISNCSEQTSSHYREQSVDVVTALLCVGKNREIPISPEQDKFIVALTGHFLYSIIVKKPT